MMDLNKLFLSLFVMLLLFNFYSFAQDKDLQEIESDFYFDAIVFKSNKEPLNRIDVYTLIPYQRLEFTKINNQFVAKYELIINISDSNYRKVESKKISHSVLAQDYSVSQGGSGEFAYHQSVFYLNNGKYNIEVILYDLKSNRQFKKNRIINSVNFSDFNLALSGILLVSSIEEKEKKFIITPHISDNVSDIYQGFFAFFEVYNKVAKDTLDFIYQLLDKNSNLKFQSPKIQRLIDYGSNQTYLRISLPKDLKQGSYILRVIALKRTFSDLVNPSDYLAAAERSIKFFPSFAGVILKDLNKSIKQLRYVANQSDYEYIESAPTTEEKQKRFEEFWKKIDPSPNTDRNEAFEEYYARIDYANKNFRSYNEGWLTDKGMVYIIFGPPYDIQTATNYNDGRIYEKWIYSDNRQFIFVDNTGFGDFRLYSPLTVTEKYRYRR